MTKFILFNKYLLRAYSVMWSLRCNREEEFVVPTLAAHAALRCRALGAESGRPLRALGLESPLGRRSFS